jgi:hypothetical protein
MNGRYTHSRDYNSIKGVAIAGFMLVTLFCKLDGPAEEICNLFDKIAWVAFEALRIIISWADW